MSEYFVVYWKKIGGFSNIEYEEVNDIEEGKLVVKGMKASGYDALIVERFVSIRSGKHKFRLVKAGFYGYLKFFTHGIYKWAFLVAIILYLYYQFIYKP